MAWIYLAVSEDSLSPWTPGCGRNAEIIRTLKIEGLLKPKIHKKSIRIDGDELNIYVEADKTSEPLYQLEVA